MQPVHTCSASARRNILFLTTQEQGPDEGYHVLTPVFASHLNSKVRELGKYKRDGETERERQRKRESAGVRCWLN